MSNRTNGSVVRELEREFARYVGAEYAIACCNGTATLHTALVALGVQPGDHVAVPPLTMASTTLAVLHAGAVPHYVDIDPDTWLMSDTQARWVMPVSLYGLTNPAWSGAHDLGHGTVTDAAQALSAGDTDFSSFSFQASKILSVGEGGMLVTDDAHLAYEAREIANLGYPASLEQRGLKDPTVQRHVRVGWNYRLSDLQAAHLLPQLARADEILAARKYAAKCYRQAIAGCEWITPQHVPDGWTHSWWSFAIALEEPNHWEPLASEIVVQGGERPYAAWRLTYQEPAFRHLAPDGTCPVAEDLQPRLVQLQTNYDRPQAEHAADCLRRAIEICNVLV